MPGQRELQVTVRFTTSLPKAPSQHLLDATLQPLTTRSACCLFAAIPLVFPTNKRRAGRGIGRDTNTRPPSTQPRPLLSHAAQHPFHTKSVRIPPNTHPAPLPMTWSPRNDDSLPLSLILTFYSYPFPLTIYNQANTCSLH